MRKPQLQAREGLLSETECMTLVIVAASVHAEAAAEEGFVVNLVVVRAAVWPRQSYRPAPNCQSGRNPYSETEPPFTRNYEQHLASQEHAKHAVRHLPDTSSSILTP